MKNKILFLDLDGTIREPKSGKWIQPWDNQKPMDGASYALAHFKNRNYRTFGITNQGGVGAGHKSLGDCVKEQKLTLELFPELEAIFFCPDFDGHDAYWLTSHSLDFRKRNSDSEFKKELEALSIWNFDSFRKPGTGMLHLAAEIYNLDLNEAWMVGDRAEDEQCAEGAGINFCPAETWRNWFRPDANSLPTPEQHRFLEGWQ